MQNLYEQWLKNTSSTTNIIEPTITVASATTNDFLNSSQNEKSNWLNSSINLPPEQR